MRWLLAALGLLLCAGMLALGTWQLDRARLKEARLQAYSAAAVAPAQPLVLALGGDPSLPAPVAGTLEFPPRLPWLMLDNQREGNAVGVRAYRIGVLGEGLPALLVEFGWLPHGERRAIPAPPPPPQRLAVDGMLLPPPSPGLRVADNAFDAAPTQLLLYLDPAEIGAAFDLAIHARVLRIDPAQPVGFARDAELLPNTLPPERHRGYAAQWFGLAATLFVIILLMLYRSRRR